MTRAGGWLAYVVSFVVVLLVLNAGMAAWSFTRPAPTEAAPSDSAWPTAFVRPTPTALPTPSASATPVALLVVTPLGILPDDHFFVFVGDPGDQRLVLLDMGAGAVRDSAHVQPVGISDFDSARSSDSSIIAIVARGNETGQLLVLHPVTGELATFRIPVVESPRISPDGRLLAVTRVDAANRGIWLIDTANGSMRSVLRDTSSATPPRALGWSRDGARIAVALDSNSPSPRVALVGLDGSVEPLGPGRGARWRGNELLYWNALKGSAVNDYDTVAKTTQPLFTVAADTVVYSVEPRPNSTEVATQEDNSTPPSHLVLHTASDARTVFADASHLIAYWWSRDGTHLYAWIDEQNTEIVRDALADREVLRFCLHKTLAPPCS